MPLAIIRAQFNKDGKAWFEAEIENQFRIRFPAPEGMELKCGDVIYFDIGLVGREFTTAVHRDVGSARICVKPEDVSDFRDRRPIFEMRNGHTVVRLLRTMEVATGGPHPGTTSPYGARYDDVESYEDYLVAVGKSWIGPEFDRVGPAELRQALVQWLQLEVVPKLKAARDEFGNAQGIA